MVMSLRVGSDEMLVGGNEGRKKEGQKTFFSPKVQTFSACPHSAHYLSGQGRLLVNTERAFTV